MKYTGEYRGSVETASYFTLPHYFIRGEEKKTREISRRSFLLTLRNALRTKAGLEKLLVLCRVCEARRKCAN